MLLLYKPVDMNKSVIAYLCILTKIKNLSKKALLFGYKPILIG